ncbi:hypothetical protein [Acididesulfobacillus acetoxydans]|nr:hypothetical protein [Acididesulfobacillus acetoxydans]
MPIFLFARGEFKETKITRQNNDVIMKAMAETFKDKSLKVFGLNTAGIKAVIPTVLPVLEVKENRTDYIFLLEDETLLHLEFMTTAGFEDLKRFVLYDARLLQRGLLTGEIKATQEAIALYLTIRYGEASKSLQDTVQRLQDLNVLEQLLKALYAAANFSEAQAAIKRFTSYKPATPQ